MLLLNRPPPNQQATSAGPEPPPLLPGRRHPPPFTESTKSTAFGSTRSYGPSSSPKLGTGTDAIKELLNLRIGHLVRRIVAVETVFKSLEESEVFRRKNEELWEEVRGLKSIWGGVRGLTFVQRGKNLWLKKCFVESGEGRYRRLGSEMAFSVGVGAGVGGIVLYRH